MGVSNMKEYITVYLDKEIRDKLPELVKKLGAKNVSNLVEELLKWQLDMNSPREIPSNTIQLVSSNPIEKKEEKKEKKSLFETEIGIMKGGK
jgi:hypothetical protein